MGFNEEAWNVNFTACWGDAVCHAEELTYVFRPNLGPIGANYTESETQLALAMQSYWATFARTGSPGDGGEVAMEWFPFVLGSETSIEFQVDAIEMQSKVDMQQSK